MCESFSASLLAADDDDDISFCSFDLMRRRSLPKSALLNSISNLRLRLAFGVFCDLCEVRDSAVSVPLDNLRRSKKKNYTTFMH